MVEVEQRLAQHRQFGRHTDVRLGCGGGDFEDKPSDLHLLNSCALLLHNDRGEAATEFCFVEVVAALADFDRHVRGVVGAAFRDREQELEQLLLERWNNASDHSEIDQRDLVIVGQEDVAGMRIGVEETID